MPAVTNHLLTCSVCVLILGSECEWGLGGGSVSLRALLDRNSSLTQTFVETSCVDFEVARFSILMVLKVAISSEITVEPRILSPLMKRSE